MIMAEENYYQGALFPVIFFDGEEEIDIGNILVTPAMDQATFRSLISQRIGISHHQLTIYFEPLRRHPHGGPRGGATPKHAVTKQFNFAAALSHRHSHLFRAVLKRPRRTRRRRLPRLEERESPSPSHPLSPFVLLRRGRPDGGSPSHIGVVNNNGNNWDVLNSNYNPSYNYNAQYMEMEHRVREELEKVRERYLMSLNLNSNVYSEFLRGSNFSDNYGGVNFNGGVMSGSITTGSDDGASSSSFSYYSGGASGSERGVCDVCLSYEGRDGEAVPFHCCKNDAITTVFRSPAGPIGPPLKRK